MGRKTFEMIGRVLPNRTNIIITRDVAKSIDGCIMANSLEVALEKAKSSEGADEIFIIGGGQIFEQALEKGIVDKLYLTLIKGDYNADIFFPEYGDFTKEISWEEKKDEKYEYTFLTLER